MLINELINTTNLTLKTGRNTLIGQTIIILKNLTSTNERTLCSVNNEILSKCAYV